MTIHGKSLKISKKRKVKTMSKSKKLLMIAVLFPVVFFVVTFTVYFFNLDMKLTAALEGPIKMLQDKVQKDRHL